MNRIGTKVRGVLISVENGCSNDTAIVDGSSCDDGLLSTPILQIK